jgi:hypothetical protein
MQTGRPLFWFQLFAPLLPQIQRCYQAIFQINTWAVGFIPIGSGLLPVPPLACLFCLHPVA